LCQQQLLVQQDKCGKEFQDFLTLVRIRKFENPNLFLPMTCNPKWADIANHIDVPSHIGDALDDKSMSLSKKYVIIMMLKEAFSILQPYSTIHL
jgi:hypothetical protein